MALNLTPEQKAIGQTNFYNAVGVTRRDFIKGLLAAGAVLPITGAAYWGYKKLEGSPIKAGIIGTGDEGGVLVGEHNPDYLQFIAYSDIRPSNQKRIFTGEPTGPRKGFNRIYGKAAEKIKHYQNYQDLLANKDIEAVVIALPLILHAPVVIDALNAGKHVLCEKLMAWDIGSCKKMIEAADKNQRILTIGHQRHYSLLYAHAEEVLRSGILGDVKHIRALWHRNNTWPKVDKDGKPIIDPSTHEPALRDSWKPDIPDEDRKALENDVRKYGFQSMEELVRWRLYNRTAAGLMAELGSHQLDACSIFLGKVHPLAVSGFGGKFFYKDDRQTDDHVFVTFEFPGENYWANPEHTAVKDKNDIVVVTYSSINTNSFEPYGECVMGTRGTMIVEQEQSVMLYPEKNPNKPVPGSSRELSVTVTTGGGGAVMDASASTGPSEAKPVELGQGALGTEPISRGYREEMEHFAYCIKMHQLAEKAHDKDAMRKWELEPKCHGRLAMADAIIALTSNQAMHENRRIEFQRDWFDADKIDAVPDPDRKPEYIKG